MRCDSIVYTMDIILSAVRFVSGTARAIILTSIYTATRYIPIRSTLRYVPPLKPCCLILDRNVFSLRVFHIRPFVSPFGRGNKFTHCVIICVVNEWKSNIKPLSPKMQRLTYFGFIFTRSAVYAWLQQITWFVDSKLYYTVFKNRINTVLIAQLSCSFTGRIKSLKSRFVPSR